MAYNLKTDYKNDILDTEMSDRRRYEMTENTDGTISLEDKTTYVQEGTDYSADDVNAQNTAINTMSVVVDNATTHMANKSNPHNVTKTQIGLGRVDNTPDSEKQVDYATKSGTATNATSADKATKLTTARNINGVAFDGTVDITVADDTKLPTAGGNITGTLTVKTKSVLVEGDVPKVVYATSEPTEVTAGTVVYVYED